MYRRMGGPQARASHRCAGTILVAPAPPRPTLLHGVLEIDAVAPGNAEQIGGTPQHIVLELGDFAVGEHHLPHHLDDTATAFLIDLAHDHAGEAIEIDRIVLDA